MDGYYLSRDPYRTGLSAYTAAPASAGYYGAYPSPPPSYRYASREAVPTYADRAYALPATAELQPQYPSYSRVPLSGYASRVDPSYQVEVLPAPRYEKLYRAPARGGNGRPKRRAPPPAQNLGPRKKGFKPAPKGKNGPKPVQQSLQQQGKKGTPAKTKKLTAAERLAQETKELHSLYRTGGNAAADNNPGKKKEPVAGVKRKEPDGKKNDKPVGQKAIEGESKKARRKRLAKERQMAQKEAETKQDGEKKSAGAEAFKEKKGQEAVPLTEEEKKEADASLELQRGACKSISEFLGIEHEEKNEEQLPNVEGEVKADGEAEKLPKQEEEAPKQETLTPEEEKEREDKGFEFFTKSFEENQELRQLYVDKCSRGTFECLVCYSIDGKPTKKFNNLVSLVMHASKVQRTLKRPEHRAYGRAVCSILGWDYNKTPKVPALKKQKTDGEAVTNGEDAGEKVDDKSEAETKVEGEDMVEGTDEWKPEDSAKNASAD